MRREWGEVEGILTLSGSDRTLDGIEGSFWFAELFYMGFIAGSLVNSRISFKSKR